MRIDLASHKSLEQVRAFLERGPGGGRQRAAAAGAGGAVRAHPAEPGAVRLQDAAAGRAGAGAGVSAADDGAVAIAGDQAGGAQPAGGAIAGPAAAGGGRSPASTRGRTSRRWRNWTGSTGGCRGQLRASCASGLGSCTGTGATSAWRASRTGMSTTCARRSPTGAGWPAWS